MYKKTSSWNMFNPLSPLLTLYVLAWYAEFLLEIDLKILLRKTGARLNFKIALISLHTDPGVTPR
jgi:hypothetical protein